MHNRGSTNRLMPQHAAHFPDGSLLSNFGRVVCTAGVLPRKELYEAWEVARRTRRRFHDKPERVVDYACGHAVLAHMLGVMFGDDVEVLAFDRTLPPSAAALHAAFTEEWPALQRVQLSTERPQLRSTDLVVSCHACGALTDTVLAEAMAHEANVVVLPCCHDKAHAAPTLLGWMDAALALDVARAERLVAAGYRVHTQRIPEDITPKNRLLLARARARGATSNPGPAHE